MTATIVAAVTARLAVLSKLRRTRRAMRRRSSKSGTGILADRPISPARRRGVRAASFRALIALMRAARTVGTSVDTATTATAATTTAGPVSGVSEGAAGLPTRDAPGLVSSGAASHPAASSRRRDQGNDEMLGEQ